VPVAVRKETSGFSVEGTVVEGHGVASGRGGDARFPEGTIALQKPHFRERGLDLSGFYDGTINVSVAPLRPVFEQPKRTVRGVKWHDAVPPEDFSFFDCRLTHAGTEHAGLIYRPHPDTKPEHEQPVGVLEVLAPHVEGVSPGDRVRLWMPRGQVRVRREDAATSD
jgi:hypothetical protein